MVVNGMADKPPKLKFGMDRILSGQTSSGTEPEVSPCAGCISSLYHCCRTQHNPQGVSYFPRSTIHAPQPLRPFPRVVLQARPSPPPASHNTSRVVSRRKRSWSRAVFSNLQRKGLEKRFQLQKYITKPDRRQLAATLGLTDAQVKVWFQNRRMKWRHAKESSRQSVVEEQQKNEVAGPDQSQSSDEESCDVDVQTVDP